MMSNVWTDDSPLPRVGDRVRFISVPKGEVYSAADKPARWLRGGALGTVMHILEGYSGFQCPDHHEGPDCSCDGSGQIPTQSDSPLIAYETREGGTIDQYIDPEDEGDRWERIHD